jgi:hypothetical protein
VEAPENGELRPRYRRLAAPVSISLAGCLLVAALLLAVFFLVLALIFKPVGDVAREFTRVFG